MNQHHVDNAIRLGKKGHTFLTLNFYDSEEVEAFIQRCDHTFKLFGTSYYAIGDFLYFGRDSERLQKMGEKGWKDDFLKAASKFAFVEPDEDWEAWVSKKMEEAVLNTRKIMNDLGIAFKKENLSQNRIAALKRIQAATDFIDQVLDANDNGSKGNQQFYISAFREVRKILWKP